METRHCLNCGTELLGEHCHACGQPVKGLVRPLRSIVHDFLDTVFEYDSRIWRTLLPLYAIPGRVTLDYLSGKRVRFVLPFRLFFVITVVTFLVLQWNLGVTFDGEARNAITATESIEELDAIVTKQREELARARRGIEGDPWRGGGLSGVIAAERNLENLSERHRNWLQERDESLAEGRDPPPRPDARSIAFDGIGSWNRDTDPFEVAWLPPAANERINRWIERAARNIERIEEEPDRLIRRFFGLLPAVVFVLVPVFALLLKVFYLFSGRLYMEHLVAALHAHSFLGLAVLVGFALSGLRAIAPWGWLEVTFSGLGTLAWWWIPLHLLVMQRRVYGQGWVLTLVKYWAIGIIYAVILAIATAVAAVVSLVTA